ncbi:MAG TPA: hypothetical protein VK917_03260 [Ilumatobacter sp.]|nr:hypothetical protein [Ilumatobacter sp.]
MRSPLRHAVVLLVVLSACQGDGAAPDATAPDAATPATAPPLPETVAVAELGYPRDLLDRGRVNVVVSRDGDEPFVLFDHQLRIDGFEPAPPEERRVVIPANGQRVAIQAIFGEVTDCEVPPPLAASLVVHYAVGAEADAVEGAIALDDTTTLAAIRSRFCTARRVLAENDIALGEPVLNGETFALDITIARRTGTAELAVHAVQGTVLFGVETPFEQGAPERTLRSDASGLVLPLTIDVNRCDPHAVAETTKKKGLTLWISVDGAAAQPVDVDISSIDDDLEEILNRCKARTGQ